MVANETDSASKPAKVRGRGLKPGQRHAAQFGNPGRDPVAMARKRWSEEARTERLNLVTECRKLTPAVLARLADIVTDAKSKDADAISPAFFR